MNHRDFLGSSAWTMYPGNYKRRINSARHPGVSCEVRVWQSCIIKAFALEFTFDPSTEIIVLVNIKVVFSQVGWIWQHFDEQKLFLPSSILLNYPVICPASFRSITGLQTAFPLWAKPCVQSCIIVLLRSPDVGILHGTVLHSRSWTHPSLAGRACPLCSIIHCAGAA